MSRRRQYWTQENRSLWPALAGYGAQSSWGPAQPRTIRDCLTAPRETSDPTGLGCHLGRCSIDAQHEPEWGKL
jgi:hypothetical protein